MTARLPELTSEAPLHDVRAAIQAAWLADADLIAIDIAKRHGLYATLCLRCAVWETQYTLCRACANYEFKALMQGAVIHPRQIQAFQQQWRAQHPKDWVRVDGRLGPGILMRGWRPYRDYVYGEEVKKSDEEAK